MPLTRTYKSLFLAVAAALAIAAGPAPPHSPALPAAPQTARRTSEASSAGHGPGQAAPQADIHPQHPLQPAIALAQRALERFKDIRDYSCMLVKRERIDGRLTPQEYLALRIRHEPFSVYLHCLGPEKPKGQEALYVAGRNDGLVLGHTTGIKKLAGTVSLEPTSPRMMEGNLYPITNIGMLNLTRKLLKLHEQESNYAEVEVRLYHDAKVDGRTCTCVQINHPVARRSFRYHLLRVYYDHEWQIPIRCEAYHWPAQQGAPLPLMEEYTYQGVQLNRGFTDADFDVNNPAYGF